MKSRNLRLLLPIFLIIFILFSSCVLNTDGSLSYFRDYLLILNSTGNVVIPYDLLANQFNEKSIPVGPQANTNYAPQQIILSADENYIYIINSLDNSVTKFTKNMVYITRYSLPGGTNPYNGFIDGNYMYISGNISAKVLKLNLLTSTVIQSEALYSANGGIQAIENLNSEYLITINTNYDLSTYSYLNSIIYILRKDNLQKVKEFELDSNFIGKSLKNFQQIVVHQESDGIYCDLLSTGAYGFSGTEDSGFLRIKIEISGSTINFTKICSDSLPIGEYIGAVSSIYSGYLYFISNKYVYRLPLNGNSISFSSGIEKNINTSGKTNLSLIAINQTADGEYIAIVDSPWGSPCSLFISKLSSSFSSINFTNPKEFSGYPVDLLFRVSD